MINNERLSGILLHPTSLPSPYGIGDLGDEAYAFIDFLARAGQHLWQVLPLTCAQIPEGEAFSIADGEPYRILAGEMVQQLRIVGGEQEV